MALRMQDGPSLPESTGAYPLETVTDADGAQIVAPTELVLPFDPATSSGAVEFDPSPVTTTAEHSDAPVRVNFPTPGPVSHGDPDLVAEQRRDLRPDESEADDEPAPADEVPPPQEQPARTPQVTVSEQQMSPVPPAEDVARVQASQPDLR